MHSNITSKAKAMLQKPTLIALLLVHCSAASPLPSRSLAVEVNNEFAVNLLQTVSADDNAFFAPLSLTATLVALIGAAEGQTAQELRQALGLEAREKVDEISAKLKALVDELNAKNSPEMAVQLLSRVLVAIPEPKNVVADLDVKAVDWMKGSSAATRDVNEWVAKETKNRIPRLFRDSLDVQSRTVVANAVHFAAKWRNKFDRKLTEKREFRNFVSYNMPGLPSTIDFMTGEWPLRTESVPELHSKLLELPFSDEMAMIFVMPNAESDLQFLNENMTSSQLTRALDSLHVSKPARTRLTLPKFRLETDLDLRETLEDLDIKTMFTPKAQLPGLGVDARVTTAVHRAVIEVDEEGREEEGVGVGVTTHVTTAPSVVVDKPFVFVIREQTSGLISFIGRVQTLVDEELVGLGFV